MVMIQISCRSMHLTQLLVPVVSIVCLALPDFLFAREQLTADITTGIHTSVEDKAVPFGYRVTWIEWDSNFRDSELQIGDRILGVNGEQYTRQDYRHHHAIGDYRESAYWESQSASDGQTIELTVFRGAAEQSVSGQLRAGRLYLDDEDRRTMGEGGPLRNIVEKDENGQRIFDTSWANWYEQMTNGRSGSFPYVLDSGWQRSSFNNRKMLDAHLDHQVRIDYAIEHYPGDFADALVYDYERVRNNLEGQVVELPANALEFRTRADVLRQEVKKLSEAAIIRFNELLGDRLEESSAVSSGGINALIDAFVGKVVYFDGLTGRNFVNDLGQAFMVAGSDRSGYFFLKTESPEMARAFDVLLRYRSLVNPKLAQRYSVWIDVQNEPVLINFKGSTVVGLLGRVAALASGNGDVFIQVDNIDGDLVFAGEEETQVSAPCIIDNSSTPEEVVTCMVATVKHGDRHTWEGLFANWRFTPIWPNSLPIFYKPYRERASIFERAWEHSRRFIMDDVMDARVNRTEPIRELYAGGGGIPKVEEVVVVLDHIKDIDGRTRTFVDLNVRRVWKLQRIDNGPWRIAHVQHL